MDIESAIKERYLNLEWALDERLRRLYAADEAKAIGHGGVTLVWKATGVARGSIQQGLKELVERPEAMEGNFRRIRRVGAGRKTSVADDAKLLSALESLVEPVTRGDPESPLRWTCKSLRQLESELVTQGFVVSHTSIGGLLKKLGYSLQGNRKTLEGTNHPDRNAQFEYINARTEEAVRNGTTPNCHFMLPTVATLWFKLQHFPSLPVIDPHLLPHQHCSDHASRPGSSWWSRQDVPTLRELL